MVLAGTRLPRAGYGHGWAGSVCTPRAPGAPVWLLVPSKWAMENLLAVLNPCQELRKSLVPLSQTPYSRRGFPPRATSRCRRGCEPLGIRPATRACPAELGRAISGWSVGQRVSRRLQRVRSPFNSTFLLWSVRLGGKKPQMGNLGGKKPQIEGKWLSTRLLRVRGV